MNFEIRDDFIGVFDNAMPEGLCEKYVDFYDECIAKQIAIRRQSYVNVPTHKIDDSSVDLISARFALGWNMNYIAEDFLNIFWATHYQEYIKKFSILQEFNKHNIFDIKIQKTEIGGGYHSWHTEGMGMKDRNRLAVVMLYLNDVHDGGETEFLYQKTRFKPVKNRLMIWPAGYTHVHRGNPPLSNAKYIVTGWIEYGV